MDTFSKLFEMEQREAQHTMSNDTSYSVALASHKVDNSTSYIQHSHLSSPSTILIMPSCKNCFLLLVACLAYANASTSSSKEVYSSLLTAGGSSTLRSTGSVVSNNIYAEELSCSSEVDAAEVALELSYTYSIETLSGASLDKIITDIEGELLLKLADTVVYCSDDSHVEHINQDGFDRSQLGIVGINSKPEDTPSELCKYYLRSTHGSS